MLPIQKKFIRYNISSLPNRKIEYIVIHDVGSKSTAENNFKYFDGGNRNASADFFVDPLNIIQTVDYTKNYSWHVGDGKGKYGITNKNAIGIEMCLVESFAETLKNTIELVKYLMKELNIDINHVIRHYDASTKLCPKSLSDNNWEKWNWFKLQLVEQPTPKKYYIVTNYIPPQTADGIELNSFFNKYFNGLNIERWYMKSDEKGVWFLSQYLSKEYAQTLADRLAKDNLLYKLVEE